MAFFYKFWSEAISMVKIMPSAAFIGAWITTCFVLGRF